MSSVSVGSGFLLSTLSTLMIMTNVCMGPAARFADGLVVCRVVSKAEGGCAAAEPFKWREVTSATAPASRPSE
jgi:hypothetical protein